MEAADIQQKLTELNQAIAGALPFDLVMVAPDDVDLLEHNARYMRNDTFAQLVQNVERDKGLASVPLLYHGPELARPLVLSGNHRVKAARVARLPWILCLKITRHMTLDEQVAVQLSHNAIAGADDLPKLKQLYEAISSLDMKSYSGLDEETVQALANIKFTPISEPKLTFKNVTLLFMPAEISDIRDMISQVDGLLAKDETYILQVRDYQEFFDRLVSAKEGLQIKNSATALLELLRAGCRRIADEVAARPPALPVAVEPGATAAAAKPEKRKGRRAA